MPECICRSDIKFNGSSTLVCPACNETVRVGFGGEKNLTIHCTSKACKNKSQNITRTGLKGSKTHNLCAFFKPCAPLNPLTVTAPLPIHTSIQVSVHAEESFETMHKLSVLHHNHNLEVGVENMETAAIDKDMGPVKVGKSPCLRGIDLLSRLEAAAMRIPADIPLATSAH
jgi:hypothetical protein